jgi:Spy/CpxP family protein refolding chaperone
LRRTKKKTDNVADNKQGKGEKDMKRTLILGLAALLLLPVMSIAGPHRGDCDGKGHGGNRGPEGKMGMGRPGVQKLLHLAEEIELTEKQRTELKGMLIEFQVEKIDLEGEVKKAHVQLKALMIEDDAGDNAVLRAIDEVSRMEAELKKMRYLHHKAAQAVLTETQIDKLKSLRLERIGERRGDRHGRLEGGKRSPGRRGGKS